MADIRHVVHRLAYQLAGRTALRKLKPHTDLDATVASSVARALQGRLDPDERLWKDSIERLRRKLSRDDTQLNYTDYGQVTLAAESPSVVSRSIGEVQAFSVPPHQGLALHALVRDARPSICVELGTCLGVSSAYIASALDLNGRGRLITVEGGKDLSRVASINFSRLGLANTRFVTGRFTDVLPELLPEVGPIDLAHVDGHHDASATKDYFHLILEYTAPEAIMVFDDIRWSRDMRDSWHSLRSHPRVTCSLDLFTFGICVIGDKPEAARSRGA